MNYGPGSTPRKRSSLVSSVDTGLQNSVQNLAELEFLKSSG